MNYKIGDFGLRDDGLWYLEMVGDRIEQGGISFGRDCMYTESIEVVLAYLKGQLEKHEDTYRKEVEDKGNR